MGQAKIAHSIKKYELTIRAALNNLSTVALV